MKPKPVINLSMDNLFRQFSILKTSNLKFLMTVVHICRKSNTKLMARLRKYAEMGVRKNH